MISLIERYYRWVLAFSIVVALSCLSMISFKGLHLGIEFTGGIEIEIEFENPVVLADIEDALQLQSTKIIYYGSSQDILVRMQTSHSINPELLKKQISQQLTDRGYQSSIKKVDLIGSEFSQELVDQAMMSILLALIAMNFYVSLRFERKLALSAVVALIHDPLVILGLFSYFSWTFDLSTLAATLAIMGYSINDTIVVFDRIRELFEQETDMSPQAIVFTAIGQTLSRTIITSLLTLFVVLALLIFGPELLKGFSLALTIGILVGTYSSIAVAGPLALYLGLNRECLFPKTDEEKEVTTDIKPFLKN